ncbi:hypothetical protein M5D96_004593 [Drosophila gunungcola]|uniref:Uncharacterized protein n=1 Tax=Drosophila gunungcola TaxID=103775 RepID=A0A9Q0BT71_9MUSC|nr:hypothetical protein M5D96_004593 [Drosophila gunungcola]
MSTGGNTWCQNKNSLHLIKRGCSWLGLRQASAMIETQPDICFGLWLVGPVSPICSPLQNTRGRSGEPEKVIRCQRP